MVLKPVSGQKGWYEDTHTHTHTHTVYVIKNNKVVLFFNVKLGQRQIQDAVLHVIQCVLSTKKQSTMALCTSGQGMNTNTQDIDTDAGWLTEKRNVCTSGVKNRIILYGMARPEAEVRDRRYWSGFVSLATEQEEYCLYICHQPCDVKASSLKITLVLVVIIIIIIIIITTVTLYNKVHKLALNNVVANMNNDGQIHK